MPRLPSPVPTEVELEILRVLWDRGPCTAREVHDALSTSRSTGYSTTVKMIQVMVEKDLLLKDDEQRPQIFRPAQSQEETQLKLMDHLIQKGFGGSAMSLVMRAVAASRISPRDLEQIRKMIEAAKGGRR